jgi:hypothetical protein
MRVQKWKDWRKYYKGGAPAWRNREENPDYVAELRRRAQLAILKSRKTVTSGGPKNGSSAKG